MTEPTPFPTSASINAAAAPAQNVMASNSSESEGAGVADTPSTVRAGLDAAKAAVKENGRAATASADQALEKFLSRVRAKPLTAIGIAFAIGALCTRVSR